MNAVPSYDAVVRSTEGPRAADRECATLDFAAIVSRYETPLLRYARQLVGGEGAEDLVQETFLRLFRQLRREGAESVRKLSV